MSIETARAAKTGSRDGVIITERPARFEVRVLVGKAKYRAKWFRTMAEAVQFRDECVRNNILLTT